MSFDPNLYVQTTNPLPVQIVAGGGGPWILATASNSTGNTTVTFTGANSIEVITITGTASTRKIILATTGAVSGWIAFIRFVNSAVAAVVLDVRNAAAGGTQLYSYTLDASGTDNLVVAVYFDGAAWQPLFNLGPVV